MQVSLPLFVPFQQQNQKVADYPFTTLVPSLGVVKVDESHSFVVADIPGLIEGASDGAGLGIRFLKHLERCRVLIHLVDINPIDESDPADNIAIIESELFQYSEKLADKPRWLVFNKIDTMTEEEAHERAQEITDVLVGKKAITLFLPQPVKMCHHFVVILWISLKRIRVTLK